MTAHTRGMKIFY